MGIEQWRRGRQPFLDELVVVDKECVIAAQLTRHEEANDIFERTSRELFSSKIESNTFHLVSVHRNFVQPVQVGRPNAICNDVRAQVEIPCTLTRRHQRAGSELTQTCL